MCVSDLEIKIMLARSVLVAVGLMSFVCAGQEMRQRHPDVGLNVKQLIKKYGYPFENHTVQTEDGYILEIHRIPNGRSNVFTKNKPVVLLVPGLLCSSADWVNMGPERSLGFILADQGYDVWLANYRGTTWSRKHAVLNPDTDKRQYWGYSFHEIGIYDEKAFIDYILASTNQEALFYIGHSQGTTSLMALLSERPEYNRKIRLATLLAPAVYVQHARGPVVNFLIEYEDEIDEFVERFQFYEMIPHHPLFTIAGQLFCNDDSRFQSLCATVFFLAGGFSPKQLNKTMIPVIASNTPAGGSIRQLQHIIQFKESNSFEQYDHGEAENMIKYGQPTPLKYDLSIVTAPLLLYCGSRDILSAEKDVDRLAAELSNVVVNKLIRGFNHLDFMWGIDAPKLLFSEILDIMLRY